MDVQTTVQTQEVENLQQTAGTQKQNFLAKNKKLLILTLIISVALITSAIGWILLNRNINEDGNANQTNNQSNNSTSQPDNSTKETWTGSITLTPENAAQFTKTVEQNLYCTNLQKEITSYTDSTTYSRMTINNFNLAITEEEQSNFQNAVELISSSTLPSSLNLAALEDTCAGDKVLSFSEITGIQSYDDMNFTRAFVGFGELQSVPQSVSDLTIVITVLGKKGDYIVKLVWSITGSNVFTTEHFNSCASHIANPEEYFDCYTTIVESNNEIKNILKTKIEDLMDLFRI